MAINILSPGETLQGYLIDKTLGVGGFGVVYLAHEVGDPSKYFAIKLLQPRRDRKEESIARQAFLNEIVNMASLCQQDTGIVKVYNTIMHMTPDGVQLGVVMEFLQGESLFDYVRKQGKMVHERAIPIILLILKTLGFAHKQGIIHRDIKPENIMVLTGSILKAGSIETHPIKIMDFGLSKAFEGEVTTESTGWGSSIYMPPERIRGVGEQIDATSDIYSVGVMAYVMLTGSFPFDIGAMDQFTALRVITSSSIPSVRESYEYHPEGLDNVIAKAMAKNPTERYQSCEDMAQDLARLLPESQALYAGDYSITADPKAPKMELSTVSTAPHPGIGSAQQTKPYQPQSNRRRFSLALVAAGVAALLVLGTGGVWFLSPKGGKQGSVATESEGVAGASVTNKNETAFERLKRDAEAGLTDSQFELAKHYYSGDRVPKNDQEAHKWYLRAAKGGNVKAQFNVALMYKNGIGVDINLIESEKWLQKASDQGDTDAMFALYAIYKNSNRIDDAIFWTKKATEKKIPKAHFILGELLEAKKEYEKAYEQYVIAADMGLPEACNGIGVLYWYGLIGNKNYKEAVKWYRKAADAGNSVAQYNLAMAYKEGNGVQMDRVEALKWFKKSAAQSNGDAQQQVVALEKP